MKITCISDTHSKHGEIPDEWLINPDKESSMIIHAGDISTRGFKHELDNFLVWYNSLSQYKYKIFIAGNHDWCFQDHPSYVQEQLLKYPDVIYLQDSVVEIEGIKIYGSPWQPTFFNWAFNKDRGEEIAKYWRLIPKGTDILITHGPARDHGDLVINQWSPNGGERVGCIDLLKAVERVKPKFHIVGHIHCGHGITTNKDTTFINAAVLDEEYKVANKPIIFEI